MPPEIISVSALLNRLMGRSHFIRGQRVTLDEDVAEVYGVSPGQVRRTVSRHLARFPPEAAFRMTKEEYQNLRGRRAAYLPYAFTEEGVLLLSTVLRSKLAAQINVEIIRELYGFRAN